MNSVTAHLLTSVIIWPVKMHENEEPELTISVELNNFTLRTFHEVLALGLANLSHQEVVKKDDRNFQKIN